MINQPPHHHWSTAGQDLAFKDVRIDIMKLASLSFGRRYRHR